jgi:hypothetical protein
MILPVLLGVSARHLRQRSRLRHPQGIRYPPGANTAHIPGEDGQCPWMTVSVRHRPHVTASPEGCDLNQILCRAQAFRAGRDPEDGRRGLSYLGRMLDPMSKSKRRSGQRVKHVQPGWPHQAPGEPTNSAQRVAHLSAPQVLARIERARLARDEAELAVLIDHASIWASGGQRSPSGSG